MSKLGIVFQKTSVQRSKGTSQGHATEETDMHEQWKTHNSRTIHLVCKAPAYGFTLLSGSAVLGVPMSDVGFQKAAWIGWHASTTHDDHDLRACMYNFVSADIYSSFKHKPASVYAQQACQHLLNLLFKQKQYTLRTKQSDLFRQTCTEVSLGHRQSNQICLGNKYIPQVTQSTVKVKACTGKGSCCRGIK